MKKLYVAAAILMLCAMLTGCFSNERGAAPEITPVGETTRTPQAAQTAQPKAQGEAPKFKTEKLSKPNPELKVYDVKRKKLETMPLEEYLEGVLAGEMPGDWPLEALKAQAILARTFVCKFVDEKKSKYDGADISTDIKEAQAYDAEGINDNIRRAVKETAGEVMVFEGELPYAWFYAHGGGKTALAKEGLEFAGEEPGYTQAIDSRDSDEAPSDVQHWTAEFGEKEVVAAAKDAGVELKSIKSVKIGEKGESGRAVTLDIDGKQFSAPALRIALGSEKMKSTLLEECEFKGGKLKLAGTGYGHGVGMSQWGAYALAKEGMKAEDIVKYYFKDVTIAKL